MNTKNKSLVVLILSLVCFAIIVLTLSNFVIANSSNEYNESGELVQAIGLDVLNDSNNPVKENTNTISIISADGYNHTFYFKNGLLDGYEVYPVAVDDKNTKNVSIIGVDGFNHTFYIINSLIKNYTVVPVKITHVNGEHVIIPFNFSIQNEFDENLKNRLISYYKFDDASVVDSAGSNEGINNGANQNTVGKINTAYSFDGFNDYININNDNSLNPANAITISAWVYRYDNNGKHVAIVDKASDAPKSYFLYVRDDGTPHLTFAINRGGTGSGAQVQDGLSFPNRQWVHVVGTYDGSTIRLYRNGVNVANTTYSSTITTSNNPLYIGRQGVGQYWNGDIDEVSIWDRALSQEEILQLYNNGNGLSY